MMKRFTSKDLDTINTILYELTCLRRWSEVTVESGKYTELGKQALNCLIVYFWANEATHEGVSINLSIFPKLALMRGFTKDFQCDVPEMNFERIFHLGNVSKESFSAMINQEIARVTSKAFLQLLETNTDSIEAQIYRAASKIATQIELEEIQSGISENDYNNKFSQISNSIDSFSNLPGFAKMKSKKYMDIFRELSKLRNRVRWAKHPNIIKCGVLGHLFDVAIFAYLMNLEVNPQDEDLATRYFFMGIFHDVAEKWTGDMPSPVKDAIAGLREATEIFENEVVEEHIYEYLPDYQVTAIKEVMMEDSSNIAFKKFLKKSDNFSAFIECWRELDAGSRHSYYLEVLRKSYTKKEHLPETFRLLTESLYSGVTR